MASDYDGAWKDLLQRRLKEVLASYFPVVAAAIDWSVPPEFKDQELREMAVAEAGTDNRVDMLVRVATRDGRSELLFLHIEVQSFREEGFESRVFRCFHGIRTGCGEEVVTLVVLADLDPSWKPGEYRYERLGCEVSFRFPCCKLLEMLPRWEGDNTLPAIAARAQIAALRTSRHPDLRLAVRWQLTRKLYDAGFGREEIREAFRVVAWMMRLPQEQTLIFRRRLAEFEQERNMPQLLDIEEVAMEEGLAKGLAKGREEGREEGQILGRRVAVLEALETRFGPVSEDIRAAVERVSDSTKLRAMHRAAIECGSLAAFSTGC